MSLRFYNQKKGFTLIEVLVVIGILGILAGVVLVAVNPGRQFKQAHDTQRTSNVNAILNAIGQNIVDNKGQFKCGTNVTAIPAAATVMESVGGFDAAPCLVPTYVATMPIDPTATGAHFTDTTDYNTAYSVLQDVNGRITVSATGEITNPISMTR